MPYNTDDSFTLPNGSTNAFSGQTIASATWNAIFTDIQNALGHNLGIRSFVARSINFNPSVASDFVINVSLTTASYMVDRVAIANASHSLTSSSVGLYTATGGGGVAIAASQAPTVGGNPPDAANNAMILVLNSVSLFAFTDSSLQFRVWTAEGAASTADVILYVRPL